MLEGGGDLDLAEEPLAAEGGRQLGLEQLDGDAPAVLQVLGEERRPPSRVAKLPLHAISLAERRRELLEDSHEPGLSTSGVNVSPACGVGKEAGGRSPDAPPSPAFDGTNSHRPWQFPKLKAYLTLLHETHA